MKVKTSELTGVAIDWAVAKAEGLLGRFGPDNYHNVVLIGSQCFVRTDDGDQIAYEPDQDWAQGGPIIERERIEITPPTSRSDPDQTWMATNIDSSGVGRLETGPTPLVAAMRCYVAFKLGDEVDVPEELL